MGANLQTDGDDSASVDLNVTSYTGTKAAVISIDSNRFLLRINSTFRRRPN